MSFTSRWLFENFSALWRQRLTAKEFDGARRELRQQLAQELKHTFDTSTFNIMTSSSRGVALTGVGPLNSSVPDAERALINLEQLERAYPHDLGKKTRTKY